MTITYTLAISDHPLEVADIDNYQNVVRRAVYSLTAAANGATNERLSAVEFGPPDETFTPFAELTEADLLTWIEALHADEIERAKQALAAELETSGPRYAQAPWLSE